MAHEIGEHDKVVLHKEKAWHGLGIVVENAPTPTEALRITEMDWEVEQWQLLARKNLTTTTCKLVANVRTDTKEVLGVVSPGYELIQNKALAEFCESLAEQNDTVKVESAGSIRNGAKVWFLLKGECFTVRDTDMVTPYILVSNGHDGMTALRCTPTMIRVVCSNTLHMVIPEREGRKLVVDGYTARHIGDIKSKVNEAKAALKLYGRSLDTNRAMIDSLAAKDVSREAIQKFFLESYTHDFGAIAETPTTTVEKNARNRALDSFSKFATRFDKERDIAGASAWNALNSYTGWLQHDKTVSLKDPTAANERKMGSVLFGVNAERGVHAMQLALSM